MLFRNVHTAASNFIQTPIHIPVKQLREGPVLSNSEGGSGKGEDAYTRVKALKTRLFAGLFLPLTTAFQGCCKELKGGGIYGKFICCFK